MDPVLDREGPCVCCDKPVAFSSELHARLENPVNFCQSCFKDVQSGALPWRHVRVIFDLRSQVGHLFGEMAILKKNMENLFLAQRDVEQALIFS